MGISYTTHTCILTLVLLFTKQKLNVISISFFFGRNQSIHNWNILRTLKSSPMEYHSYIYISHYDILQNYMKYLNFYPVIKLWPSYTQGQSKVEKLRITINCLKRKISTSL